MSKRQFAALAATLAFIGPANADGPTAYSYPGLAFTPAYAWSATPYQEPLVGPVYALHPSYLKPFGVLPEVRGVRFQQTPISHICRVAYEPAGTCWLWDAKPLGTECGCPPAYVGAEWTRGAVAAQ